MGDGGVACIPLQQHIMERLPNAETTVYGGKNGNGFNSKLLKLADSEGKKKMNVKKVELAKKVEVGKSELVGDRVSKSIDEIDSGEIYAEKSQKEDVEEGELITLKYPRSELENGEFAPDKPRRSEIENGEIVYEEWKKRELEKGGNNYGRWRKENVEKGEIVPEKGRKGEAEDDLEYGEFIPDRWHRGEVGKDDHDYNRSRRHQFGKGRGGRNERERTPPPGRYYYADFHRKKEFNRSGNQHAKSVPRWENGQQRNIRISSKIVNEKKNERSNDRNHAWDYSSGSRLKRHGNDSDSSERKHYGDYAGLKTRRLSDEACRTVCSDHTSGGSVERSYRNSFSSSSKSSVDKYSRHRESSLSTRKAYDRHVRSPGHSEWSPRDRGRYYGHRDTTLVSGDRSPYGRDRSPYSREKSTHGHEKSPHDVNWDRSGKVSSPTHVERSSTDVGRHNGRRDGTPNLVEQSPMGQIRQNSQRETGSKILSSEKHISEVSCKELEDKQIQRESNGSLSEFQEERNCRDTNLSIENNACSKHEKEQESCSPAVHCKESPHFEPPLDELPSMEEDMDICDTPPHDHVVASTSSGKWFYLDYSGAEHGPSKLCEIRALVDEGVLMSDHFIKHLDSNRWLTVENAVSPLAAQNFSSIVSDTITKLVSPPEAPGNFLADSGDIFQSVPENYQELSDPLLQPMVCPDDIVVASEHLEDLHIDERVGALLESYDVTPGMELQAIKEALQMNFEYAKWEELGVCEGFPWHEEYDPRTDLVSRDSEPQSNNDKDSGFAFGVPDDWYSARWSCKGGDWKWNEDVQDISFRKKLVLNDGFPLCQMPKSGCEDPRWLLKDDLYHPSHSMKLDLPLWGFCADDRVDSSAMSRPTQSKPAFVRGMKGNILPVIKINACVVNGQGSLITEPRHKAQGNDRYQSRTSQPFPLTGDNRSSTEDDSQSKSVYDQGSYRSIEIINTPKDRMCTVHDMQVHSSEWYYLDDSGHARGPSSFSELQVLVDQGIIKKYSSVFRKCDKLWVPVTSISETSDVGLSNHQENTSTFGEYSELPVLQTLGVSSSGPHSNSSLFNNVHPQFVSYTCGKLHELVMKSFKSREFAAAINEVLDPWINARQPKQELDKQIYRKSEVDSRASKKPRLLVDDNEEDSEMEDGGLTVQKDEFTFEDLCGEATFFNGKSGLVDSDMGSWGLLDGHMLGRVFHFLRSDLKSLAFASMTCKHWRAAVRFYKEVSKQVNLSSLGPSCTDSMLWNVVNGYEKGKIRSIILTGCKNITADMLEKIILSFSCLSTIDIRGCSQFGELTPKFSNLKWIKSQSSHITKIVEEPHKIKTLKWISEKTSSVSKNSGLGTVDDFGELKDYFNSVEKRDASKQLFRQNLYKRSKLYDARRSSSILSRDARTRRWTIKKSENGYKRMEEFLYSSLREIMKENFCEFFVPKVAEIEAKMKIGYYSSHGLSFLKDDISRMCRDAIKAKNRGDAGDMDHVITLFIRLATQLEKSYKSFQDRDALLKSGDNGFCSTSLKYKKNKLMTERKYRSNGTLGGLGNGNYVSERELRKRLSKLNKQSMSSESETSDDFDGSSKYGNSNSETTTSCTESDQEVYSRGQTAESRDGYFIPGEGLDFITDDREWGARMTKASLVPPVTRKYEVIDHYVIVADEEDVQRKMWVSLPDDYAEKLTAQKNGTEESDMELPEVKDYKPRKQLGDEVIEQEVYGIDPYTHNLLLDSMPEELDWPLEEKHVFIEDMLLRALNKKVSHFTGIGNTPMSYPLQPVIEEIKDCAEVDCDLRIVRMCQGILKAIESRPDDKYVAYRKGLGVVCNKEGGFGEDDFVVEFLGEVYPVWKWFEKQDGIRSLQKNSTDPAPEFYNIYLERPKGDAEGYDLVVVDAMHKANYASRICHSCRPNCEAKVTAVDGRYLIGIYTVRKIQHGEEITFDYNSVTESKEEYEASVCLCGSQVCRGSYLNLTGEGAFQKVLKESHGILDRHFLMLEACELNSVSEEDYNDLGRAGLGSCLLGGLPDWLVAYAARLVRFINFERTKLPEEILRHNLEEKRKYFSDICLEVEKSDADVQAEGVYNQRLQNLAVTLDKVRYVMRSVFGDPRRAPPPLVKLSPEAVVSFLWKGENSFVEELLQCMAPHMEEETLNDLKCKIHAHDPSGSGDIEKELQNSLLWLRDEVRNLRCTYKCRHDAAADLIHIYAYTKYFFRIQGYETITSPPVYISPLDLGPKYTDKLGTGVQEYQKTYGENYCLGQLIFWYNQSNAEPDCRLARASRGCLSLPDIDSFYDKVQKPSQHYVYGPRAVKSMLGRMEKQPQRPWPKDQIWTFKSCPKFFGSPMLDAVIYNSPLDREMLQWLKHRPAIFQAIWDR